MSRLRLVRIFEEFEALRDLRQRDGGVPRLLLASALSYAMRAHLQEEFIRDSSDLRYKDLATMIVRDDDNDNRSNNNDDTCMVG